MKLSTRLLAVAAALSVTMVAGCSSGGSSTSSGDSAGGSSSAAATTGGSGGSAGGGTSSITIGLVQAQDFVHAMPARVAEAQGFFKEQGLDAKVIGFSAGSDLTKAMAGGSVDVGAATGLDAVAAAAHNLNLQAFYGVMSDSPMALIVPTTSSITSFKDLEGKKVGISKAGSLTDFIVKAAVTAAGGSPDKVTEVPLGDPASTMAGLKRGDVDAFVLPVNFGFIEQSKGEGKIAQKASDALGKDSQFAILMAQKDYIAKHSDELKRLAKAYTESITWMKNHEQETVDLAVSKLGMKPDLAKQTYEALIGSFTPDGQISAAGMKAYADALSKLGIAPSAPSADAYLSTAVVSSK